jgi:hypothetical protein
LKGLSGLEYALFTIRVTSSLLKFAGRSKRELQEGSSDLGVEGSAVIGITPTTVTRDNRALLNQHTSATCLEIAS